MHQIWVCNFYREYLKVLAFISVKLKMAEDGDVINEEIPSYPFGALVSDIGGAMGLLLGLSVLDLLVYSGTVVRYLTDKFGNLNCIIVSLREQRNNY